MKYKNELDNPMIIGPFKIGSKCIFDDSIVPIKLKKVFTALENLVRRGVFSIVVEEPVDLFAKPEVVNVAEVKDVNVEVDKEADKDDEVATNDDSTNQVDGVDKPRKRGRKAVTS